MKLITTPFLWLLLLACNFKQESPVRRLPHTAIHASSAPINYDSCKQQILIIKRLHGSAWNSTIKKGKEMVFTRAVTETIIPNWMGTKWDFNGTSEIPQQGSIACGYFVTTVLRDAGLRVARVKLAQMASEQMITSLVQAKYIQRFSNVAINDFTAAVTKQGFGLYLIGLDNHTGFIYNDGDTVYFIHSSVVGTRNVQKEIAANSWVLQQSKYKVLGKISADEKILNKWINP
ncbi:MAG: hypothetical protein WCI49_02500 [Ferruginibacter sp.]